MSTTSNIAGVTYLGCKSHFDFGNYNRGVILEMTPTSVEQCALQCAGRSFNRLSISDQACACYMDVNLVIVDQNIIECNKYCGDGPCGTADFINRFSVYDITLMRDTVQASITASISASIAAERSRTEGLRSSTLSSVTGTINSVAITTIAPSSTEAATTTAAAIPTATPRPTALSPEVINGSNDKGTPFILQTGGILMMVSLAILVAIAGFVMARYYKSRNNNSKSNLPVFTVLHKRPSSDSVSLQHSSVFSGSTLGRGGGAGSAGGTLNRAGGSTPVNSGSLERTGTGRNPSLVPASPGAGLAMDRSVSAASSVAGSPVAAKDDLVRQMFGLTSVMEESNKSSGDPLSLSK